MSAPAGSRDSSMSMNVVTTVMAFSVSAFFVLFIFIRLLCARIHLRTAAAEHAAAAAAAAHAGDVASLAIHVERGIRGMEPSMVTTFPTAKFGDDSRPPPVQESQCTVCLEEYEAKDVVRVLPYCGHAFHVACIDTWLKQQSTCPICRASMRATAKHRAAATMRPPVYYAVAMAAPPPPFQVSTSSSDRNATLQAEPAATGTDHRDMGATASGLEISSDEPASSGTACPSVPPAAGASEDPCSGSTRQSPHGNDASDHC